MSANKILLGAAGLSAVATATGCDDSKTNMYVMYNGVQKNIAGELVSIGKSDDHYYDTGHGYAAVVRDIASGKTYTFYGEIDDNIKSLLNDSKGKYVSVTFEDSDITNGQFMAQLSAQSMSPIGDLKEATQISNDFLNQVNEERIKNGDSTTVHWEDAVKGYRQRLEQQTDSTDKYKNLLKEQEAAAKDTAGVVPGGK